MRTAICSSTDRNFLPAACLALKTGVECSRGAAHIDFFLVLDESVSKSDVEKARRFLQQCNGRVALIEDHGVDLTVYDTRSRPNRPGFLRLHYHEFLPPEYTRIIHIDADMRVQRSLVDLANLELAGRPVGAVHELAFYAQLRAHEERALAGLKPESSYFNAGLLVIDRLHGDTLPGLTKAQRLLSDPQHVFTFEDQTALNVAFDGNWRPIDPRWNVNDYLFRTIDEKEPYIYHFTSTKPWQAQRSSDLDEFARWYTDQTVLSPWPDFVQRRTNDENFERGWWKEMRKNARRFRINRIIRRGTLEPGVKRDFLIVTGRLKKIYDLMISEASSNGALQSDPQAYFQ